MVGDAGFEPDVVCDENRVTPCQSTMDPCHRKITRLNPDPPRDADRRLSKVGDVARRTQASPTREHVGGLFGPDCKGDEQGNGRGSFVQEPMTDGSK